MKITITESDIKRIVKRILNEQSKEYMDIPKAGCETYKKGCDPFRYLKVVDGSNTKYYYKKDNEQNWTQAKSNRGISSIEKEIKFKSTPESESKLNTTPVVPEPNLDTPTQKRVVKGNKMKIDYDKLNNGDYTKTELTTIVNDWKPTYDFDLKGSTNQEQKMFDWKINVDKTANAVYDWRNRRMEKIKLNPNINKSKKKKAEADLFLLTQSVVEKLEKEYEERWKGVV